MALSTPATTVDPNWLLSTAAQSGAALVAIVGGFLVSRLVSISAERESFERRQRELVARRSLVRGDYAVAADDRFRVACQVFLHNNIDDIVAADGEVDANVLVESGTPRGATSVEMLPYAERLVAAVRDAFVAVGSSYRAAEIPKWDLDDLRAHGIVVPADMETAYLAAAEAVGRRRQRKTLLLATYDVGNYARPRLLDSFDRTVEKEGLLRGQLLSLDAEIDQLDEEIRLVGRPRYLVSGIVVLAYFAAVGVVTPLAIMASRPVSSSLLIRRLVFYGFASGLFVLLVYIVWAVLSLRRPAKPTDAEAAGSS